MTAAMHVVVSRRNLGVALTLVGIVVLLLTVGHAEDRDAARDIMRRVLRESRAEDEVASVLIELIDARRRLRQRTTTVYAKKRTAEESARLIRFHAPPDLARSAILTIEHADRDADQWIYLPAYHAARRVASADRGDTWMGTDLTYEDMTDPRLDDYTYTTLRHERLDQANAAVIEAAPRNRRLTEQSAYSKTIYWIDPDESVAMKIEYYDRAGRLLKVMTNTGLQRYGKYRRWSVTQVHDVTRDHRTVLTVTDRKIDRGLRDEQFTVTQMERGR